jgi:ABC-type branched-subunit amino acid transport system substrate-binding protein
VAHQGAESPGARGARREVRPAHGVRHRRRVGAQLGSLVGDLRAALGPGATIVAPGLLPISMLFATAGPAARGMLITSQGLPPNRLGPSGRRFVREFGATQPGPVATLDVYAAAATEILLDAIARSDGTRESVARALKDVDLSDSVLGPLALDGNGEPTSQAITVLRAVHGGSRQDITLGTEGSTVVDVITPPARLVGPVTR